MDRRLYKLYLFAMGVVTLLEISISFNLDIEVVQSPFSLISSIFFGSSLWTLIFIFRWWETFRNRGIKIDFANSVFDFVISLLVTAGFYVSVAGIFVDYLLETALSLNALVYLVVFISSINSFLKEEKKVLKVKLEIRVVEKNDTIYTEISKN